MKGRQYIGVTGFTQRSQVEEALRAPLPRGWSFMVGVLANRKTITGEAHKHPNRHVDLMGISSVFMGRPNALNIIHFTGEPENLEAQLDELNRTAGPDLHGFQINMPWPEPKHLGNQLYGCDRVILQIGREAMRMCNDDPNLVALELERYKAVVTDVLIDESGGKGVPLDPASVIRYFEAISSRYNDHFGLGFAGGLSRKTMHLVEPVLRRFPTASFDAQGKMRDSNDELSMPEVNAFVTLGSAMIEYCERR
jgi:hypothetical protein